MTAGLHSKPEAPSSDELPVGESFEGPAGLSEAALEVGSVSNSDDEDDLPTINDVESLKKGIIKTSKTKGQAQYQYTILLVGETGTGKSSLLELIANVLHGKTVDRYDFGLLDHSNEQGGSSGQSQTNSARVYEFTSRNGVSVRILDAPGFADTRGIQQDELHKESIAVEIKKHIDSVSAILILANGTTPITTSMDYALSAVSALFPKSMANNIAFMFSNTLTPLSLKFSEDAISSVLKNAPQFLFDNPIALQKKYLELKDDPKKKKVRKEMRKVVLSAEQKTLEMLVSLFDWLDGLGPQPTTDIAALYKSSQDIEVKITSTLAQMDQTTDKMMEVTKLMEESRVKSATVNVLSHLEEIMNAPVWKPQPDPNLNYLCTTLDCYSTCGVQHSYVRVLWLLPWQLASCPQCKHPHKHHYHWYSKWVQVQSPQVLVDNNVKELCNAAKDTKEKTEAHITACKEALDKLNHDMDRAMDELVQLVADYSSLSLSGSFSAHLEKTTLLLERRCTTMEEKGAGAGADAEQLAKMQSSLNNMKRKRDLLKEGVRNGGTSGSPEGHETVTETVK